MWEAAIGAGIGAIGNYNAQKEAKRSGARALDRGDKILGLWDEHDQGGAFGRMQARGGMFGIREEYMRKLLENAEGGFLSARRDVRRGGRAAKRTMRAQGKQASADVQQGMASRGLYGSTLGQQAASGVNYQVGQSLADVDAQIGSMLSDLDMQETQVMDSLLRGNLGIEDQSARDMMAYVVANTGHGPGYSSTFFNSGAGRGFEEVQPYDGQAVGFGVESFLDNLGGTKLGNFLGGIF